MRTRLLANGPASLADYEMLEMLFFLSIPRRDTKPLAKSVLNRFGDLYRAFQARPPELREMGIDDATLRVFALVREAARRLAQTELTSRPLLSDHAALAGYLDIPVRQGRPPHVAALLLNNRNQLLADLAFTEAHDVPLISRDVARRAVSIHASALILATFRPGPVEEPTKRDCALTERVAQMGAALSVTLHDHLLFGTQQEGSFRRWGLL